MVKTLIDLFIGTVPWAQEISTPEVNFSEVLFTRLQYCRNFLKYPFVSSLADEQKEEVVSESVDLLKHHKFEHFQSWQKFSEFEKKMLEERFLISSLDWNLMGASAEQNFEFAANSKGNLWGFIHLKEHLVINKSYPGLPSLKQVQNAENDLKFLFNKKYWSYSEDFGFLTSDPRNVGKGAKLSMAIHFPATFLAKKQDSLINAAGALGFFVSPPDQYYSSSDILQLTYKKGISGLMVEYPMVLKSVKSLLSVENALQKKLLSQNKAKIEDKFFRAWWTLKSARLLSYRELLECSSLVKWGARMGYFPPESLEMINILQVKTGHGHILLGEDLQMMSNEKMDEARALMVRLSLHEFEERKTSNP